MKSFESQQIKFRLILICLLQMQVVSASDGLFMNDVRSFTLGDMRSIGDDSGKASGISFFNRFLMNELNTVELYLKYPNRYMNTGMKLSTFGYEDYRLSRMQAAFSKSLVAGLLLGIHLNVRNETSRWEERSKTTLFASLGMYYHFNRHLDGALWGENLFITPYAPTGKVFAGMQYQASETAVLFLEAGYGKEMPFRFALGIEYTILELFSIRSGYASDSDAPSFGAAYRWEHWRVDVGFSYHAVLGMSSGIGVSYTF